MAASWVVDYEKDQSQRQSLQLINTVCIHLCSHFDGPMPLRNQARVSSHCSFCQQWVGIWSLLARWIGSGLSERLMIKKNNALADIYLL